MPSCAAVTALSDSDGEQVVDERPQKRLRAEPAAPSSAGGGVRAERPWDPRLRTSLARLTQTVCFCSRKLKTANRQSCFLRFRDKLDELVRLRQELSRLHKLDADHRARCWQRSCLGIWQSKDLKICCEPILIGAPSLNFCLATDSKAFAACRCVSWFVPAPAAILGSNSDSLSLGFHCAPVPSADSLVWAKTAFRSWGSPLLRVCQFRGTDGLLPGKILSKSNQRRGSSV